METSVFRALPKTVKMYSPAFAGNTVAIFLFKTESAKRKINDTLACARHYAMQMLRMGNVKFKNCLHPYSHVFNNHIIQMGHLLRKSTVCSSNSKK